MVQVTTFPRRCSILFEYVCQIARPTRFHSWPQDSALQIPSPSMNLKAGALQALRLTTLMTSLEAVVLNQIRNSDKIRQDPIPWEPFNHFEPRNCDDFNHLILTPKAVKNDRFFELEHSFWVWVKAKNYLQNLQLPLYLGLIWVVRKSIWWENRPLRHSMAVYFWFAWSLALLSKHVPSAARACGAGTWCLLDATRKCSLVWPVYCNWDSWTNRNCDQSLSVQSNEHIVNALHGFVWESDSL